jgi:flagellin-specific chaperone FliS
MNPYHAYQQHHGFASMTRIDLLLSLYDASIQRVQMLVEVMRRKDVAATTTCRTRALMVVMGLAAGVQIEASATSQNLFRLYEFAVHCLQKGDLKDVEATLRILGTLREGFQGIRDEALRLERSGEIPPVDSMLLNVKVG